MKRCFVIMGYGKKTDFESGRLLDLDRTYEHLIKPAVEAAGLACIRADEIRHSGVIDVTMYNQLLSADVVVADISTSNANAIYELGIRHALRPQTTVVISEKALKYPFDLNHIAIMHYVHHGEIIDVVEAKRFVKELEAKLVEVLATGAVDSPVYTFVNGLMPPSMAKVGTPTPAAAASPDAPTGGDPGREALPLLRAKGEAAITRGDFAAAEAVFLALKALLDPNDPNQVYIAQRLTLATYKGKKPSHVEALLRAQATLAPLGPRTSNDPETLGLAGAIEKRLFEENEEAGAAHLDASIRSYERGFYLRHDHYNGINFAFMLDVRAARATDPDERTADRCVARRIRREVLAISTAALDQLVKRTPVDAEELRIHRDERYWLLATIAEAHAGIGAEAESDEALRQALTFADKTFMRQSTEDQLAKLRRLRGAASAEAPGAPPAPKG